MTSIGFLTSQVQGRILTVAGITVAICAAPFIALLNMVALAVWPTWVAIAVSETLRKVSLMLLSIYEVAFDVVSLIFTLLRI